MSYFAEYQVSFALEDAVLQLQTGVLVNDGVGSEEYSYFAIGVPPGRQSLRVILTPNSGDPDLFISTSNSRPNFRNFTWRSIQYGTDSLTITTKEDPKACSGCTYYIGVYGFMKPATFR